MTPRRRAWTRPSCTRRDGSRRRTCGCRSQTRPKPQRSELSPWRRSIPDEVDKRVCRVVVTRSGRRQLEANRSRRMVWLSERLIGPDPPVLVRIGSGDVGRRLRGLGAGIVGRRHRLGIARGVRRLDGLMRGPGGFLVEFLGRRGLLGGRGRGWRRLGPLGALGRVGLAPRLVAVRRGLLTIFGHVGPGTAVEETHLIALIRTHLEVSSP